MPAALGSRHFGLAHAATVHPGLRNTVLKVVAEGKRQTQRLLALEQLANNEHRRLLASIEMLARLERRSPVVTVSAHQAAVVLGGGSEG